jgi:hypothetical protein
LGKKATRPIITAAAGSEEVRNTAQIIFAQALTGERVHSLLIPMWENMRGGPAL